MRGCIAILILVLQLCGVVHAQTSAPISYSDRTPAEHVQEVKEAFHALDAALLAADTATLALLLNEHLRFKHSNGWVETKSDLMRNSGSGYLKYIKIEQPDTATIVAFAGKKGGYWHDHIVKRKIHVVGILNGIPFDVNLVTTEQWIFSNERRWVLSFRESVKAG